MTPLSDWAKSLRETYPDPNGWHSFGPLPKRDVFRFARLWLTEGIPFAFRDAPAIYEFVRDFLHGIRVHAHGHALVRAERIDGDGKRRNDAVDGRLLEQQRLAAAGQFHFAVGDLGDFEFGGDGLGNAFEFARAVERVDEIAERIKSHTPARLTKADRKKMKLPHDRMILGDS